MGRDGLRKPWVWLAVFGVVTGVAAAQGAADEPAVEPDPETLRFAERALPWYPDSVFTVTENIREMTPSGSYRRVAVTRDSPSQFLSGTTTLFVDEIGETIWVGSSARLPVRDVAMGPGGLRGFIEQFVPEALAQSLKWNVRVDWDPGDAGSGAIIPFTLHVETGYGSFPRPAAVTADGGYLILGSPYPMGADPVEYRRQQLHSSDLVMWDHDGAEGTVEVVEFSDLECPACRRKWPLLKDQIRRMGPKLRHGMVSFPLTTIHPWAFRAASASWCVSSQDPALMNPFKELFYSLQTDMNVSEVTPTAIGFVAAQGLDEQAFRSCYLKSSSLEAVHGQIALANRFGVASTPTYVVDGWVVQVPEPHWFPDLLDRLAAGKAP